MRAVKGNRHPRQNCMGWAIDSGSKSASVPRLLQLGSASLPAAEQIDCCAQLEERIGRWSNSIHPRDRVEDDVLLLGVAAFDNSGQLNRAQCNLLAALRPVDGSVVRDVLRRGNLSEHLESNGTLSNTLCDLIEVIIRRQIGHLSIGEEVVILLRNNAVAAKLRLSLSVRKPKCSYAKIRLSCQAGRKWLGGLHKCQRGGMRPQEELDRFGRRHILPTRGGRFQKLEELRSIASGEPVSGMTHDVGMHVFREVESNCQAARVGLGRMIRYRGKPG